MSPLPHRALQVDEVLSAIFRQLSPYVVLDRQEVLTAPNPLGADIGKDFSRSVIESQPCSANQRALLQASTVSRLFSTHALKVLWKTLPDLSPLQHLLDVMGFTYADPDEDVPIHTFSHSIHPTSRVNEWARFRWYTSCVLIVRDVIDLDAFERWSDRGGPPFLPALQMVRFRFDPRCVHRILRFIPPSLEDITLDFNSSSSRSREQPQSCPSEILWRIAARAPSIQVLNLTFRAYPNNICPSLTRFSSLRALIITGWMTPSLHEAIESLENLQTLYVKLYWTRARASMENLQFRRYRSVKRLVVLTLTYPLLSAFQSTEFPSLESVLLEVWPHSSDSSEAIVLGLGSLCNHTPRLRTLSLTTRSAAVHGDHPPPRLVTLIEPLLHKPTLENISLTLEDNYSFALTREDILSFPTAWPNLVTLCLAHAPLRTSDPAPPIRTFFDLIAACPRLETLVLCAEFDCTRLASWQNVSIPPHESLRGLFLGLDQETGSYYPEKTWRGLAAALDRCVPRLDLERELVRPNVVGARAVETWQTVVKHVQDIRAEYAEMVLS
ncbi:hypothetical protein C8Q77DRAFT_1098097 [Trametes polyzona]|nr:hypothetical protein C8Q77DRAFT_1098097 [Trametes polyzona]